MSADNEIMTCDTEMEYMVSRIAKTYTESDAQAVRTVYGVLRKRCFYRNEYAPDETVTARIKTCELALFRLGGSITDAICALVYPLRCSEMLRQDELEALVPAKYLPSVRERVSCAREAVFKVIDRTKRTMREVRRFIYNESDRFLMSEIADRMFGRILDKVSSDGEEGGNGTFAAAYEYAKGVYDKEILFTGEPTLFHYLRVAELLINEGFDSDMASAAMLRGAIEKYDMKNDGYSDEASKLKVSFSGRVYSYVGTVYGSGLYGTAELYSGQKARDMLYRLSVAVSRIKSSRYLLPSAVICAADCVNSLEETAYGLEINDPRATDSADDIVEMAKSVLYPFFEELNMNMFTDMLDSLFMRILSRERYYDICRRRDRIYGWKSPDRIMLRGKLDTALRKIREGDANLKIHCYTRKASPYEIASIYDDNGADRCNPVEICDIVVSSIEQDDGAAEKCVSRCIHELRRTENYAMSDVSRVLPEESKDKTERYGFTLSDGYGNAFIYNVYGENDYKKHRYGCIPAKKKYTENDDGQTVSFINVYGRNGKVISVPEGSTVLDLAFFIHHDIGLSFVGASVNGNKVKINTRLRGGDKCVITYDSVRNAKGIPYSEPHACIDWFNYVSTDYARKKLIHFLKDKYGEADAPDEIAGADINDVRMTTEKLFGQLGGVFSGMKNN